MKSLMLTESDRGSAHLALLDGGQTNLGSKIDNNFPVQTALTLGEGGLPHMQDQGGAASRWFTFQPASIPQQSIESGVRHLNHAVGVR